VPGDQGEGGEPEPGRTDIRKDCRPVLGRASSALRAIGSAILGTLVAGILLALLAVVLAMIASLFIHVPCLDVREPAQEARAAVQRDLERRARRALLRCTRQGGDPGDCQAEIARRRDHPIRVADDSGLSLARSYVVTTANGARYEVTEQDFAGWALCRGMGIEAVSRPE
jgi:hypothetical protein